MPEDDDNDLDLDLDLTFEAEPETAAPAPAPAPIKEAPPEQPKPAAFKKRAPESKPSPPVELQPRQEPAAQRQEPVPVPAKFPPPRPAPAPVAQSATPAPPPQPAPAPAPAPQEEVPPAPAPRPAPNPQPAPQQSQPQSAPAAKTQPAQIPQKRTAPQPPPQAQAPANPLDAPRRAEKPRPEREPRKRRTQQTRPPREQKSPQGNSFLQNKKLLIGIPAAFLCLALIAFAVLRDKEPKDGYPVDVDAIQNRKNKTTGKSPAPVIGSTAETNNTPPIDRSEETPDERDERAEAVLGNFFGATKPEAMLSYVRDPKRVAPLMADYYGRERYQSLDFLGLKSSLQEAEAIGSGFYAAEADIGSPRSRTVILEDTPQGMRIDWEYYVQYNPMNWMTFIKEAPSPPSVEPMDFRVLARIVPDYRHPFTDEKRYLAVDLVTLNSDAPPIIGYAVRNEPLGKELQAFLEGKQEEMCILKLEFPARSKPGDTAVYIRELVNPHWIITDEAPSE